MCTLLNLSGLVADVLDTLATYHTSKDVNDLLPLIVGLADACEPVRTNTNLAYWQYCLLCVYDTVQSGYIKGRLNQKDIETIEKAIDKIGLEDL